MVNWMRVIGENFTINYLLLALYSEEELSMVSIILNTYGVVDDAKELVIDYISHRKINLWR